MRAANRRDISSTLLTTMEQFEGLHLAFDKTRTTSATVKVDRQALANILIDHSKMVERLERIERS